MKQDISPSCRYCLYCPDRNTRFYESCTLMKENQHVLNISQHHTAPHVQTSKHPHNENILNNNNELRDSRLHITRFQFADGMK